MLDNTKDRSVLLFFPRHTTFITCFTPRSINPGDVINHVMTVVIAMRIRRVVAVWVFPPNKPYIDVINIACEQREVKSWHLQLWNVTICLEPDGRTEVFVLIPSSGLR